MTIIAVQKTWSFAVLFLDKHYLLNVQFCILDFHKVAEFAIWPSDVFSFDNSPISRIFQDKLWKCFWRIRDEDFPMLPTLPFIFNRKNNAYVQNICSCSVNNKEILSPLQ
jgi:hypothetical protein